MYGRVNGKQVGRPANAFFRNFLIFSYIKIFIDETLEELKEELTKINEKISSEIASSMAYDGTGKTYDRTNLNSLERQKRTILEKIEFKKAQLAAEARLKAEKEAVAAREAAKAEAARVEATKGAVRVVVGKGVVENKKFFEEMRTMGIKYKDSTDDQIRQQIESDAKEKSIKMIKLGQVLSLPAEVYSEWPITWFTYARLMHHFYYTAGQVIVVSKLLRDMLEEYNIDNTKYSELEITSDEKDELDKKLKKNLEVKNLKKENLKNRVKNLENRVKKDFPIKNLEEREDKYFYLFS